MLENALKLNWFRCAWPNDFEQVINYKLSELAPVCSPLLRLSFEEELQIPTCQPRHNMDSDMYVLFV